jgi:hypothetical protein
MDGPGRLQIQHDGASMPYTIPIKSEDSPAMPVSPLIPHKITYNVDYAAHMKIRQKADVSGGRRRTRGGRKLRERQENPKPEGSLLDGKEWLARGE